MLRITARAINEIVNGKWQQGEPDTVFSGVSIDSRSVAAGNLFVALKGEKSDGHNYIAAAFAAGAAGVLLERPWSAELARQIPTAAVCIAVPDCLQALQQLAAGVRRQVDIPCIGITGSNGKTTTKDLLWSILKERWDTLKPSGNHNNELGLPLTILELTEKQQAMILEMGMRGLGQIDFLCRIARPDIAVITTITGVHLELLHSIENIAAAKGEILEHIDAAGLAVLNGDNPWVRGQAYRCRGQVVYFGLEEGSDFRALNIRPTEKTVLFDLSCNGEVFHDILLGIPGRHNVMNALAAIAVAWKLGLEPAEIRRGLKNCSLSAMRLEIMQAGPIKIINDCYNANPESTCAALQVLHDTSGSRHIAVLADMFELGNDEQEGHLRVGRQAASLQIDRLITIGSLSHYIAQGARCQGMIPEKIAEFPEIKQAIAWLRQILLPGDVILIKGSRSMALEEIVQTLSKILC